MNFTKKTIGWNPNLCGGMTPITPAFHIFQLTEPRRLKISAHIGLKHRKNYSAGAGWGVRFGLRSGSSEASVTTVVGVNSGMPPWIAGAKTSGNLLYDPAIPQLDQHYATALIVAATDVLQPGWYRVEAWGNCHGSSGHPVVQPTQSIVEVNGSGGQTDPENCILYEFV